MKKKRLIISAILGLSVALFVGYLVKYQQVVTEGSLLVDEHCIKINPLIIERKNRYIDQYNLLLASASAELYLAALDKYKEASKAYIKDEQIWLTKQRKYLDGLWFNLLILSYIKEAGNYQYDLYEAEYNSSRYLMDGFDAVDLDKQLESSKKAIEETERSKEAGDKYKMVFEREKGSVDWHYYFVKVPPSKCPPENYNIPVPPNPFAPPVLPRSPVS